MAVERAVCEIRNPLQRKATLKMYCMLDFDLFPTQIQKTVHITETIQKPLSIHKFLFCPSVPSHLDEYAAMGQVLEKYFASSQRMLAMVLGTSNFRAATDGTQPEPVGPKDDSLKD